MVCRSIVEDVTEAIEEATNTIEDAALHAQRLLPSMLRDEIEEELPQIPPPTVPSGHCDALGPESSSF